MPLSGQNMMEWLYEEGLQPCYIIEQFHDKTMHLTAIALQNAPLVKEPTTICVTEVM